MVFWIVASLISLVVAGLLARALLRGRSGEEPPAAYDLRVYRDQLKEIDKDLARGVIAKEDAERVRAEVSRRILTADAQLKEGGDTGGQPRGGGVIMALVMAAVLLGALGAYYTLGAPGYADMPLQVRFEDAQKRHESRPTQAEFEAKLPAIVVNTPEGDLKELVIKLRETVASKPDDLQGHMLLARTESNLGNDREAYKAQQGVIRLKGDEATADDHVFLAELMISAAHGYTSPEAEDALNAAIAKEPRHPIARFYLGDMMAQAGRPDMAFYMWEKLFYESDPAAPWLVPIRARIQELAWMAGEDFQLPPPPAAHDTPPSGPSQADMEAASDMSAEERGEMIQTMVANLSERLATEGGSPAEWARLIGAYGVLGQTERAQAVWEEARLVFGDDPAALEVLKQGAQQAGLTE